MRGFVIPVLFDGGAGFDLLVNPHVSYPNDGQISLETISHELLIEPASKIDDPKWISIEELSVVAKYPFCWYGWFRCVQFKFSIGSFPHLFAPGWALGGCFQTDVLKSVLENDRFRRNYFQSGQPRSGVRFSRMTRLTHVTFEVCGVVKGSATMGTTCQKFNYPFEAKKSFLLSLG